MTKTIETMIKFAEENGIIVHFSNKLGNGVDGIYWVDSNLPPVIGINKKILSNTRYARCVLAEEIGHHFTTIGAYVPKEFYCYTQRCSVERTEYRAMKWAAT